MVPSEVAARLTIFFQSKPDILVQIPAGSGICSIATVGPKDWVSGFISTRENRWNKTGQPTKYFSSDFHTCAAELYGADESKLDEVICERWTTTGRIVALDIFKFPEELQIAFYEDKGMAPAKWTKPHLFLDTLAAFPDYSGIHTIYAPSASGLVIGLNGNVFVADPGCQPLKLVETGVFNKMIQPDESENLTSQLMTEDITYRI